MPVEIIPQINQKAARLPNVISPAFVSPLTPRSGVDLIAYVCQDRLPFKSEVVTNIAERIAVRQEEKIHKALSTKVENVRGTERFYQRRRRGGRSPRCPNCHRSMRTGHSRDCRDGMLVSNRFAKTNI